MSGMKALVALAFAGSIGMTFIILACGLPQFKSWWPFGVVAFHILSPVPTLITKRYIDKTGMSTSKMDLAIFITMGFVISSFALPTTLARKQVIRWAACHLTTAGNIIIYATLIGFFIAFYQDDADYTLW